MGVEVPMDTLYPERSKAARLGILHDSCRDFFRRGSGG